MDMTKFWKLIDKARRAADGDLEDIPSHLTHELTKLSNENIILFDQILNQLMNQAYSWNLWGVAYIIGGGCSDDSFTDFRAWLISKGKKAYETGLINPDALTRFIKEQDLEIECQLEGFLYVASQAWEEKTGQDLPTYPLLATITEPIGISWAGHEDSLTTLLPKIWKKFGD